MSNISTQFKKGVIPWNTGKKMPPMPQATRDKISDTHKSLGTKVLFNEEIRKKMRKAKLGTHQPPSVRIKQSIALIGKMPKNNMVPGKFGNVKRGWFDVNGKRMFFRSKWEVNYAIYLDWLKRIGQIKEWFYEEDVFIFEKIKFGVRSYRPDFKVFNNDGTFHYDEVKGWMDSKSATKIKRMRIYFPDIKLTVIDKKAYNDIKRKVGKMLKFYE